jgi:acyl carrier protein
MDNYEGEVRAFIDENFVLVTNADSLPGDASLTRSGVVDSVGIVELIHFLETRFGITIADDELVPENIDTIDNIVRYLRGKLPMENSNETVLHDDARI